MTPDGRYVAFASAANDLVPNDTNGIQDIFVRDTQAGQTFLTSPGAIGAASNGASSDSPEITSDGRYVAFRSTATNLVYSSPLVINEIYVTDLIAGKTILVSTNAHNLLAGTPISYNHVISDDGQFVVFESSSGAAGIIQRYNLQTGFTDLLYTNAVASTVYNHFRSVDMTPDGRFVTFRFVVGAEEPGDPQRLSRAEAVKIGKQVAETGIYDSISASPHVVKSFGRHLWRYGEEGK